MAGMWEMLRIGSFMVEGAPNGIKRMMKTFGSSLTSTVNKIEAFATHKHI